VDVLGKFDVNNYLIARRYKYDRAFLVLYPALGYNYLGQIFFDATSLLGVSANNRETSGRITVHFIRESFHFK